MEDSFWGKVELCWGDVAASCCYTVLVWYTAGTHSALHVYLRNQHLSEHTLEV